MSISKHAVTLMSLLFGLGTYGQVEKKDLIPKSTSDFFYFEIPAAINGSNIDPSPISNISSNFTESKLSVKIGFPNIFRPVSSGGNFGWTAFLQPYVKATNGVSTLWRDGSKPTELGVTGGYSLITKRSRWNYSSTGEQSSVAVEWINLTGSIEKANYNLFNPTANYGNILTKRTETNSSLYLSFNRYFMSTASPYKYYNLIYSVGGGYAKTNNYASLKSRTLQEGKLHYNADSTSSQMVTESTSGRNGVLEISEGFTLLGEMYKTLFRNTKYGSIYIGARLTYYGIGKKSDILNGNTGFYFNIKDQKPNGKLPSKDVVNFSITGQFDRLNRTNTADYIKNNFSVLFQAAVPIRFN